MKRKDQALVAAACLSLGGCLYTTGDVMEQRFEAQKAEIRCDGVSDRAAILEGTIKVGMAEQDMLCAMRQEMDWYDTSTYVVGDAVGRYYHFYDYRWRRGSSYSRDELFLTVKVEDGRVAGWID